MVQNAYHDVPCVNIDWQLCFTMVDDDEDIDDEKIMIIDVCRYGS